jgi:hypothetical protein
MFLSLVSDRPFRWLHAIYETNRRLGGLNVCSKSLATFLVPLEGESLVNVRDCFPAAAPPVDACSM